MISDRTRWRPYQYEKTIYSGGEQLLRVSEREFFTRYQIESFDGTFIRTILYHDVRNCTPPPAYYTKVIYAQRIPWFVWCWRRIRQALMVWRQNRQFARMAKRDAAVRKTIREMARRQMGAGRFGGRYNR